MENPYTPPAAAGQNSERTWIHTGSAIVSGFLSLLMLGGIVSNVIIFAGFETWPDTTWQWVGIVAMNVVVLMTSIGFAHISVGLLRSIPRLRKRGLWIVTASVAAYVSLAVFSVMMKTTT
ncbi:hypothetical protein [Novipirellula rosea]|uniref:Succinate dehydrogenase/Fumarate reductase transmembrane subunit n=1 Tax=Novipirellula rosea TaxID=1031540 RepID=A0ABP8NJP2_9BACT